ncbi:hypothetical protein EYV94_23015 [Puteibacter caeruleilacunae]|nr:hypothetical protein EYV94_23015 [Puteibacter caeruleilacunae]
MVIKYLSVVILAIILLMTTQVRAQEENSILLTDSIQSGYHMQPELAQPVFPLLLPALMPATKNKIYPKAFRIPITHFQDTINYSKYFKENPHAFSLPEYPGLADYRNYGGTLGRSYLTNNTTLNYSAFINVQYGYGLSSKQIVFGGNLLVDMPITQRLHLLSWVQYVTPGNSNDPVFNMRQYFPMSNIGANLQYKSSRRSQIKVGVEYQYDQNDKTWKPESGGKVQLNF